MGRRRVRGISCAAFCYAYNGLITSTNPRWLQRVFNTLTVLLNRMGLHNNVIKTVGVIFLP